MSCEEVLHLIQRLLDHDLTEDEHRQLEQHLSHCPSCAATFQKYQALHQRLEQLPQVNPPLSIVDRIDFAKVDENNETIGKQSHTSTFLSSRKIVWAIGGVAALILALAAFSLLFGQDHEQALDEGKRIDGQDQPYYISANPVSSAWIIEEIEWVSDHELYYVLYHEERDERQYWLFNAEKREEVQLEGPYPEYQPEGS
ncbi:hypothetical protein GCM10010965_09210 [Caldalkalibacillus thermarum]|uniref:anti-sigma factor family protein n=1 Tax=Caldalkalibacillus thermarum TaxID=296745 RepID=UPI00166F30E3|nr:zf-HC2 domain-containing protein [Caldalkalibacillus thermarum]GGK18336.1 hypothetical protein GCM10010965_09210 [Caldalkalibacillus thermarum]